MTNTALSTSRTDVNNALNGGGGFTALSDGDTCIIPAGSSTWASTINTPSHMINITGAGTGQTNITGAGITLLAMNISGASNTTVARITGISFISSGNAPTDGLLQIGNTSCLGTINLNFRIDHCDFTSNGGSGTRMLEIGSMWGLVDHCTWNWLGNGGQAITLQRDNTFSTISTWYTAQVNGDENAVVIEDCHFNGFSTANDGAVDCYPGMKYVGRHNVLVNCGYGNHGYDSTNRGARMMEIYDNTCTTTSGSSITMVTIRSGSGVIWGNTADSGFSSVCLMNLYRGGYPTTGCVGVTQGAQAYAPAGIGGCVTNPCLIGPNPSCATGSNPVDGNVSTSGADSGYPLLDQVGRGSFPNGVTFNAVTGWSALQALEPLYLWSNTVAGNSSPTADSNITGVIGHYLISGRDYYDNTSKPGYTPLVYPHPLQGVVSTGGGGKKIIRRRR